MSPRVYSIKIAGPAGLGIKSFGQTLSQMLIGHGLYLHDYSEYPSLVRGGHNTYQLSFSSEPLYAPYRGIDIFFALKKDFWQQHKSELKSDSLLFSDQPSADNNSNLISLPLSQMTEEIGHPLVANTICLGVVSFILQLDVDLVKKIIRQNFSQKTDLNLTAFQAGYDWTSQNCPSRQLKIKFYSNKKDVSYHDGNEAFGWGFIKGKGNFYAAYPMTPATGALHFLAKNQQKYQLTVVHPEDEIAAASMAVGASFAGKRAATGSSGGGFALTNETLSFAGMAEIGYLTYLVTRPGPATGLPTWTSQGDLLHAIYSGHGEFPKVVLAPGDQLETFHFSSLALDLAAILQTPIILLSDKFLAESAASTPDFSTMDLKIKHSDIKKSPDANYSRYSLSSKNGISPLTIPGMPQGSFLANSYEHDEQGFATEDAQMAVNMTQKRLKKLEYAQKIVPKPLLFGNEKARKLIVSWGSTKGPILQALRMLPDPSSYAFLQLRTLWPINPDIQHIINGFQDVLVIEQNITSQLSSLLKSQFNFNPTSTLLKFDGRPFFPEELYEQLK